MSPGAEPAGLAAHARAQDEWTAPRGGTRAPSCGHGVSGHRNIYSSRFQLTRGWAVTGPTSRREPPSLHRLSQKRDLTGSGLMAPASSTWKNALKVRLCCVKTSVSLPILRTVPLRGPATVCLSTHLPNTPEFCPGFGPCKAAVSTSSQFTWAGTGPLWLEGLQGGAEGGLGGSRAGSF